jgi:hypothetical protein
VVEQSDVTAIAIVGIAVCGLIAAAWFGCWCAHRDFARSVDGRWER